MKTQSEGRAMASSGEGKGCAAMGYQYAWYDGYDAAEERRWWPWLVSTVLVVCFTVFFVEMFINDCPGHGSLLGDACIAGFRRRFAFPLLCENPLLGPSSTRSKRKSQKGEEAVDLISSPKIKARPRRKEARLDQRRGKEPHGRAGSGAKPQGVGARSRVVGGARANRAKGGVGRIEGSRVAAPATRPRRGPEGAGQHQAAQERGSRPRERERERWHHGASQGLGDAVPWGKEGEAPCKQEKLWKKKQAGDWEF